MTPIIRFCDQRRFSDSLTRSPNRWPLCSITRAGWRYGESLCTH